MGIVAPNIRRDVYAKMEITKQMEQETHTLFGRIPARSRLKSRNFLTSVKPLYFPPKALGCNGRGDHSLQAVGLSQTVVQIVSNPPTTSNGGPDLRVFWGGGENADQMDGWRCPHKSG